MPLVPETYRCAVALALNWEGEGLAQSAYLAQVAAVAEADSARLQLFVPGSGLQARADVLASLVAKGHVVDLLLPEAAEGSGLADALAAACEQYRMCLGREASGLRLAAMRRNGLHSSPGACEIVAAAKFGFVSSDYSTKNPDDPRSVGFTDKNAAMLMKHQQPRKYPCGVWEIPSPGYSDRAFFEVQGRGLDEWIAHLQQCVDFAHDMGGLIYAPLLHLDTLAAHDPEARSVHELLEHAGAKKWGDVAVATYRDVLGWAETT